MRVGWGGAVPAFRQVFSSFFIPSAGEEQKRWYDERQQASSSGEMAARLWLSNAQVDISETARRITQLKITSVEPWNVFVGSERLACALSAAATVG